MAAFKTHNLLPEIFRTDSNKKFLNATLDQLISEPNFTRLNGYIGRKDAPTFKSGDSYVPEIDTERQNYQLEPSSVVYNPETDRVDFYAGYTDLVNKIKYYGGKTDNHSRLFNSDTYSFDGKFDFDKFVNFNQYYWLPNGPAPVTVSATGVPMTKSYLVKINNEANGYYFGKTRVDVNPEITLAQGGVYEFVLDGLTGPFWIQSEPAIDGYNDRRPNVYTRDVFGVENNGASTGVVKFKVPKPEAQARFINMVNREDIDYASELSYREIVGATLDDINRMGGLDGKITGIDGKKIIFVNPTKIDDYYWTNPSTSEIINENLRTSTWLATVNQYGVVELTPYVTVNVDEKVFVKLGTKYASKSFYVNYSKRYKEVPLITSNLVKLYYQSGNTSSAVGVINLVAVENEILDPNADIIGKVNFTSANGIAFTNGLKVSFDNSVVGGYAGNTYIVEGVGKSIRLVPFAELSPITAWNDKTIFTRGAGYGVGNVLTVEGGEYNRPAKLLVTGIVGQIDLSEMTVGRSYRILSFGNTTATSANFDEFGAGDFPDVAFLGFIVGNELNVSLIETGFDNNLSVGIHIFGPGVPPGTYITALGNGTGGVGTYTLNNSVTLGSYGSPVSMKAIAINSSFIYNGAEITGTGSVSDGAVTDFEIFDGGDYITLPDSLVSVAGGSGTGAKFLINLQPQSPEYVTINRSSLSRNAWARSNRWFHVDVIRATASYLGIDPIIDQDFAAKRPIIEFDPDIKLFNNGTVASKAVDKLDTLINNVYLEVESTPTTSPDYAIIEGSTTVSAGEFVVGKTYIIKTLGDTDFVKIGAGSNRINRAFKATGAGEGTGTASECVVIYHNSKVIFSNEATVENRQKIFDISIADIGVNVAATDLVPGTVYEIVSVGTTNFRSAGSRTNAIGQKFVATNAATGNGVAKQVNYIAVVTDSGETVEENTSVLVKTGANAGSDYWFNGTSWNLGQQKTTASQEPLFDVFDANDISFGDTATYNTSSFIGTKLFSYSRGTGTNDSVLGFPLSYRNFQNVGDIQFDNNFDADSFEYLLTPLTKTIKLNTGNLHIVTGLSSYTKSNMWAPTVEKSKQYQLISHTADGVNNLFEIDILPEYSTVVPNIKVSLNNKMLDVENFGLTEYGARFAVFINPDLLTAGDNVNIYIYSNSVSKLGYYKVPVNLDNNSENADFSSLTLGQLRNHLSALGENSLNVAGNIIGVNNIRDTNIKQQAGNILKHSAPVIYSQLFLVDETLNYVNGLRLAQKEYTKFKNKFLELSETIEIDVNDIAGTVDSIITQINGIKNINFPWYYSDMVPWGNNKTVLPEYKVLELRSRRYDLTRIFDDKTLSNRAVLIYHTRTYNGVTTKQLLVKDIDYVFNPNGPNFRINDSFNLNYGDTITVVEYNNTDGNFIPETPTKLGLWPKFTPEKYLDNTYTTAREVIQGHDGSITPAFGDYRDELLLELERRIYNNIKTDFKFQDMIDYLPGKFRNTEYTYKEFNQILSNSFLSWAGNNRLDYTTNDYFQSNNPWTWNYKNFKDNLTGDYLPGYWRGIYKHFFDTDRPHTHPWEMLGFTDMPDWWIDRYGTAPYTGGNLNLWSDLSIGYIHAGPRAGIDKRYARPGLTQIVPVDDAGNLRSPEAFLVLDYDSTKANASYAIGDHGPIETAWRRSSDFPFALQLALALMKPAEYFGKLATTNNFSYNADLKQYIVASTNKHLVPIDIVANGFVDSNNNIIRTVGYINWIAEYLKNLGISNPQEKVRQYLSYLAVQLTYKVGGFTDKNYVSVLAEQGSPNSKNNGITIPDENYRVILNKSVPVNKVVYSAVIVEKSPNGYTVSGYNLNNPYFTIVPSQPDNNFYTISAGIDTGIIYKSYQRVRVKVPYGNEFNTKQQVVDFLVSYQRHLLSQGFVFSDYSEDLNEKQDWVLSAREFLTWAQQGWKEKNLIILSPVNTSLRVVSKNSVVDEITNTPFGAKVLNPNFGVIKSSSFTVSRDNNRFNITSLDGQTIAYAELNLIQYEHVIVFDNLTVFNDVIYAPETGNRQFRLKLVGYRTANWTGALNPPGFIYNNENIDEWTQGKDYRKGQLVSYKNFYYTAINNVAGSDTFNTDYWKQVDREKIKTGLLPNYATQAAMFNNFYDIDNPPASEKMNFYSSGITGFRERKYLTDLSLDNITQGKFYSGFIKQKGTKNAILALASAQLGNVTNEISVYEEWGVRVGDYGATGSNEFAEVVLDEQTSTANPMALEFLDNKQTAQAGTIVYRPVDLYKASQNNVPNMFDPDNQTADRPGLPTAGYVNVDDIDRVIYDLANYRALGADLGKITTGYTIWTAKDFTGQWNVFRVNETNNVVLSIGYNLDNIGTVTTRNPHGLSIDDIVVIKDFNGLYNGFYQVYSIVDSKQFNIVLVSGLTELKIAQTITGVGYLFKLSSSRVETTKDIDALTPASGWLENDKVWVDNLDANGNWGVYNKTTPWDYYAKSLQDTVNTNNVLGADSFGTSVAVSSNGRRMYVGAPGSGQIIEEGVEQFIDGQNYRITYVGDTDFTKIGATQNQVGRTFRANMAPANTTFIEGTTGRGDRRFRPGRVVIFDRQDDGTWKEINNILGVESGELFGYKVLASDRSLIVSSPGKYNNRGVVYVYNIEGDINLTQVLVSPGSTSGSRFGSGIAISQDGNWLYVSEGATGKIFAYGWDGAARYSSQIVTANVANIPVCNTASDIYIRGIGTDNSTGDPIKVWVPEVHYSVSNDLIVSRGVTLNRYGTGTNGSSLVVLNAVITVAVNQLVTGYGVPAGTFVSAVHSGNSSVSLTQNLTSNISSSLISFSIPTNGSGSNTIELFDTTSVATGQMVTGAGISPETYVTGVSGTTVNLSAPRWSFAQGVYRFTDPKITFDANVILPAEGVSIIRRPNYKLIQQNAGYTFRDPADSVTTGFGFAEALSCNSDGSQIIVGAPTATSDSNPQAGLVHIYNRSVEEFIANGVNGTFTVVTPLNDSNLYQVRVNGIPQTRGVQYTVGTGANGKNQIIFASGLFPGEGEIVSVDTNWFTRVQTMGGSVTAGQLQVGETYTIISLGDTNSQTNFVSVGALRNQVGHTFVATGPATGNGRVLLGTGKTSFHRLGTATEICPNSCSIYAGAANYSSEYYTSGAVYRFVNQGKLFGEITGTTINPLVTPGDAITINGITVEFAAVTTDKIVPGNTYKIVDVGSTLFTSLGAADNNVGTTFTANASGLVTDGNLVANRWYKIETLGNTNWTRVGAVPVATSTGSSNIGANLYISGTTTGTIVAGQQVNGTNIVPGTKILGQVSGVIGGAGLYIVDTEFAGAVSGPIKIYEVGQKFTSNSSGNAYGTGTAVQGFGTVVGLTSVVNDINVAYVPGVTAYNNNGYLKITSDVISGTDKLDILPGKYNSTAIQDLGLEIFILSQLIKHPGEATTEKFGSVVKVSGDANQIAVGSAGAATVEKTTFDNETTTFDAASMQFIDQIANSGAVYLYDLLDNPFSTATNPALMSFVQQLQGPGIAEGFGFGSSIVYHGNHIYAGAPKDSENGVQLYVDLNNSNVFYPSGSVYDFINRGTAQGWDLIRFKEPRTSVDSISKIYLYNKKTQQILATLDIYDPVKGKVLGMAEQDIDFKSEYDPATYNDSGGADDQYQTINELYHWGPDQVGKTWWDLSSVRFVDYEQGELSYRNKHWGEAMEGSEFKVYEWVESTVPPSQYNAIGGDGTVKYPNNERYVSYTTVEPSTGQIQVRYYYWVADKASVDINQSNRRTSSYSLQLILSNPKDQGVPFAAPIAPNALSLFNVARYLVSTDVVLHIDHSPIQNTNIIHNEYELIKEGDSSELPTRIINKLEDSLAGVDSALLPVPDPKLKEAERYGIELRPRQTMFIDRLTALENFVKFSNNVFTKYPVVDRSSLHKLFTGEELPVANSDEWDITVNNHSELGYLNTDDFADGYLVAVLADEYHSGHWVIYEWVNRTTVYNGTGTRTLFKMNALPAADSDVTVKVNNVTVTNYTVDGRAVKFNSAPALNANISITAKEGWRIKRVQSYLTSLYWYKTDWYDSTRFDYTQKPTYTVDNHFDLEKLTLAEGDIVKVLNDGDSRFAYYIYENGTVDRVGSENGTIEISSTVYDLINNRLGYDVANYDSVRYDQYPVSEIRFLFEAIVEDIMINDIKFEFNDLFFSLVNYIYSEQAAPDWIFKTSFITVLHKVRELAQYPSFIKNNETFYEDYINEVKPYRTKIREYVQKQTGTDYLHTGATDFDLPSYYDTVSSTYRSPTGTGVYDQAILETENYADWNNNYTYKVVDIKISDGGSGFNFIPNVTISGGGGAGAVAHLFVSNGAISSVEIINPGSGYTSMPTLTINGDGSGALLTPILKNEYFSANNKQSYNVVRSFDSHIKFDRVVDSTNEGRRYESNVVVWAPNTAYTATISTGSEEGNIWLASGNFVAYGGDIYVPYANANVYTETTFNRNLYQKMDQGNVLINGIDRIIGYYQPGPGMLDANVEVLINATEYPGVKVTGAAYTANTLTVSRTGVFSFSSLGNLIVSANTQAMNFLNFTDNNGVTNRSFAPNQQLRVFGSAGNDTAFRIVSVHQDRMELAYSQVSTEPVTGANITLNYLEENDLANFDAVISSTYLDTSLGVRPEDIDVDGGAYVDVYSSYAPEELLPGRMYDTLEIQVFTANTTTIDTNVYYIYRSTVSNTGYGYYYPGSVTKIYDWMYTSAASIVAGNKYEIITQGTIDYTTIGAPDNNAGTVFVATGGGYGGASAGNVFSVVNITVNGISNANLTPVVAANGAVMSITVNSGGYGLIGNSNPTIVITGANYAPASGNVYVTQDAYDLIGYRAFHTMNAANVILAGNTEISYHRISAANTTVLTQDFHVTDSNIYVEDASILASPNIPLALPGVVFINGEKIHYFRRDTNNNVLGYLRRAVEGTGAATVYPAGTRVVDSGIDQEFSVNAVVRKFPADFAANSATLWGNTSANIFFVGSGFNNGMSNVFAGAGSVTTNTGSPLINGVLGFAEYKQYFGITGDVLIRTEESLLNVGAGTAADGLGMANSVDYNVTFLKSSLSYKP